MYFAIFDTQNELTLDNSELNFINIITKVIQSIAQRQVTKNSLIASYEVLRDILSNIGSGIIVCSENDGSVFFENYIASTSQEVRRTIKECIDKYFSKKYNPVRILCAGRTEPGTPDDRFGPEKDESVAGAGGRGIYHV